MPPGSDFTITIAAGRTSGSAAFTLTPTDDTLVEGNETITVGGTATGGLTVNGASLALTDDDRESLPVDWPPISLAVDPASVTEGGGGGGGDGDRDVRGRQGVLRSGDGDGERGCGRRQRDVGYGLFGGGRRHAHDRGRKHKAAAHRSP